jgi:GT2 family glycosyltransferase
MAAQMTRASLIVVTWNAVEWSRRCIESIVEHTGVPYELIVVDNGSTDATRDFLRDQARNATVILNDTNLGFGVAANIGAARAKAPILVFINSDVIVSPGWLEPLCRRLEDDSDIAVAGPKILDLDGRIDHAGALLAHDAWGIHYGAGDDPDKREYGLARRVDYVTGACLAVRTRLFHETGGFDPWFETAYFEDADLCFRLAAQGWRILYEPASVVTHAGGASGTPEGTVRLLAINQPRFQQRWRDRLRARPDAPLTARPERIIAARAAAAAGTILFIGRESDRANALREQGYVVDVVDSVTREWLETRRFHYDAVAGAGPELAPLIAETQPQALLSESLNDVFE